MQTYSIKEMGFSMSDFIASVQYNDFKGTSAADRSDSLRMVDFLVDHGLASNSERVVGYRIIFDGNDGREIENPGIVIYLAEGSADDPTLHIRAVEVEMTTAKFFSFFKRFDCVFTLNGNLFEDAQIDGPHYP